MTHTLNLTIRIKQDAASQALLKKFTEELFPAVQNKIAEAMKKSRILHFARVVVIENKYLQVLTEYDGDRDAYTEFFRRELPDVFKLVFSLAEDAPDPSVIDDKIKFLTYARSKDIHPIGKSISGDEDDGWVFSAYNHLTVEQVLTAMGDKAPK